MGGVRGEGDLVFDGEEGEEEGEEFHSFRSAPAQNALPLPVMIPHLSLGSASSHAQTESSSACCAALMQLS